MHVVIITSSLSSGHVHRGIGQYTRLLMSAFSGTTKYNVSFVSGVQVVPQDADLVHYPFFDPFLLTLPLQKSKPTVVTVHDLIPIAYPQYFPKGIVGTIKWNIQRLSLLGARAILTDSINSKNDIVKFSGFSPKNIHVVYLAPGEQFKPTKQNIRVPNPYILYVGDVNWNKNIPGLLHAFSLVKKNPQWEHVQLVLVGRAFLQENLREVGRINSVIRELNLESFIQKLGFVKNSELSGLYAGALLTMMPSFAEGFGLPILEAMQCGCPVVTSDISSLTEIAGPAIQVNPYLPEDMARGMSTVLSMSHDERKRLIKNQLMWVNSFTMDRFARETWAAYESAV